MSGNNGFSEAERAAIAERAAELSTVKNLRGSAKRSREHDACVEAIEALTGLDSQLASRLHLLVTAEAPQLCAKTWYGFPAYAWNDKVVVFFQPASKFETKYATLGFTENSNLEHGSFWPTSFALTEWSPENEKAIRDLIKRAVAGLQPAGI